MRVLALNPYDGVSHRAFLEGWSRTSRHDFSILRLPAFKWKWRMRHAAITFAEQLAADEQDTTWDVLFCTDMLNLAEFLGLCPASVQQLPRIVYFHENQLTYPGAMESERDMHFAFTNLTTALAASQVWFNSAFHRDDFLSALADWIKRLPEFAPTHAPDTIRARSDVLHPGIDPLEKGAGSGSRIPSIVWAARWEHDKNPEDFFLALTELDNRRVDFRLNVLGQSFRSVPKCFSEAHERFCDRIDHWGFLPRDDYVRVLSNSDISVSTAAHEFFGLAAVESAATGCFPVLPKRLAYPEVFAACPESFYDGTVAGLVDRLEETISRFQSGTLTRDSPDWANATQTAQRFIWKERAAALDEKLESCL